MPNQEDCQGEALVKRNRWVNNNKSMKMFINYYYN